MQVAIQRFIIVKNHSLLKEHKILGNSMLGANIRRPDLQDHRKCKVAALGLRNHTTYPKSNQS